ncbi:hypothetical protein [Bacillus massiliigorillae]|uniref:hypothetical protein n=1 Tax=Bacillus massiliigorillae TaxID=1243664 RepID=UPI00039E524D|nr:hypothetical protein [Bacillus massiliigorillae]
MQLTIIENTFRLANPSASFDKYVRDQIEQLIESMNSTNTIHSINDIHFVRISEKSFTVVVQPKSAGWKQELSNQICQDLNLSHLKDPKTNRLFL